jgi:formylmethanofuran dehydrogenase subunit B
MSAHVVPYATCTFCGCVCDDIELHADDGRIVNATHACALGASWFRHHHADHANPDAMIDGKPASLDAAIDAAAGHLDAANLPLVYGLSNATCEAQREAVLLAEAIGGVIDSHTSLCHGPTEIGSQLAGMVTCTLGEVTNRADFILYWGANPAESHPRHFTKYTLMPKGRFVPAGRKGRTMVLVDVRDTPSVKAADVFLRIRPGTDFEAASALRAIVKGLPVHRDRVADTGLAVGQLEDLAARMKRARFGAIFFGMGLAMTRGRHMNAAAILTLTAELNAFTKFVCMPMRGHGNVAGADAVLRRMTGYAFGVDFSRGYPRSNPGEFSAVDMLARGDNDATLVVGADPGATMPQAAIDHLGRVPTIVLDPKITHTSRLARVHITTAATGVSAAGTVHRMDGVPLPLRPALRSPYPTDEEVVRRIRAAIGTTR